MKKYVLSCALIIGSIFQLWAYDTNDSITIDRKLALNIYLDCTACDINYFKENFSIVNYVREPDLADVHIQVTTLTTGSGGTEYNLLYLGRKRFQNLNDTVVFCLSPDQTYEKTRQMLLKKIQLGLVPYIMKTSYANHLYLTVDNIAGVPIKKKDPWKNWMFEIYGSASLLNQKYMKNNQINASLYISKVTPDIKFESANYMVYNETRVNYPLNDSTTYSNNTYQKGLSTNNLFVISMGNHFGIGGLASFRNSHLNNLDFQVRVGPAIEYSLFKYTDAAHKQLRFLYSVGYEQSNYAETTIYNKMNDYLYKHNLSILFMYIKPWGYFNASLYGSNYLNDFSHFSVGTSTLTNIRIVKGLSFNVMCGLYMYRDQITLKKGVATMEELLTSQREMEKNYSYNISFGLTFRFGSKFNNVVNPRFEN
jgi:hypothetical protein